MESPAQRTRTMTLLALARVIRRLSIVGRDDDAVRFNLGWQSAVGPPPNSAPAGYASNCVQGSISLKMPVLA